ncbi:alpha-ketoglutarate-dependent dioxygenase FTO [Electrophorus electricus]|uniref:alpha-ketoglutarate-dependent dioxygenase FTO n=1 Tax=Electrophorus electricus TaxID=8005 RepID=UPI0015CFD88E|nr:alpha-ketoglutarate-dependent dioxygenase FTO [Electrophorus electricus]
MKRSDDSEREKRRKRRRLLQELGEQRIPFLSPSDAGFQQLWESSYAGLTVRKAGALPGDLHERVQSALSTLLQRGCLLRDLVRVRDRDVFTAVSRALVGQPGCTYRYLDTRLFTIPWHCGDGDESCPPATPTPIPTPPVPDGGPCCDTDLRVACKALWELNRFFCVDIQRHNNSRRGGGTAGEGSDKRGGSGPAGEATASGGGAEDRVLEEKEQRAEKEELKQEPYYGMGKMAVGWHHDENLVPLSPLAVYSYSCPGETKTEAMMEEKEQTSKEGDKKEEEVEGRRAEEQGAGEEGPSKEEGETEEACWRVGLKVAWDIHTPGLALPLQSGDCYYMTDDLNRTHQHCVLAGETARFSSTHRVAQCSTGTLEYIQRRCSEALENLHTDPESGAKSLRSLILSTLQHIEDIHNEVEFEWLRQYWFQGRRYARFCSWWSKPMERLEADWKQMERMTELLLALVEDESSVQENRREMAETLLNALTDRQQHRQTWRDRCQSNLAQTLPPEEAPIDRPYWSGDDPDMPLPFDLSDIISRVESLLWRM